MSNNLTNHVNFENEALKQHSAIVIHCAATRPSMDIGAREIESWHRQRNFNTIGYHLVIRRDGKIEHGRSWGIQGAHASGFNRNPSDGKLTFGICLVGGVKENDHTVPEDNFTDAQWASLNWALKEIVDYTGIKEIYGHRELPGHASRGCPSFDIEIYRDWFNKATESLYLPNDWYKSNWKEGIDKEWNKVNLYKEINVDYGGMA